MKKMFAALLAAVMMLCAGCAWAEEIVVTGAMLKAQTFGEGW